MRLKGSIKRLEMPFKSKPDQWQSTKRGNIHMFYVWWEGFLSPELCEHFKCHVWRIDWVFALASVCLFVFASDIVVLAKGDPDSTDIPRQIKRPGSDCTGWRWKQRNAQGRLVYGDHSKSKPGQVEWIRRWRMTLTAVGRHKHWKNQQGQCSIGHHILSERPSWYNSNFVQGNLERLYECLQNIL